jgi:hypothetical protein
MTCFGDRKGAQASRYLSGAWRRASVSTNLLWTARTSHSYTVHGIAVSTAMRITPPVQEIACWTWGNSHGGRWPRTGA